jgi:hypothetical protein
LDGETDADYRISKELYIGSFKDKSDSALIIKVADRLMNVDDFYLGGDFKYSGKYLAKANALYLALEERVESIGKDLKEIVGRSWNQVDYIQTFVRAFQDFDDLRDQYRGDEWDHLLGRLDQSDCF